MSSLNDFLQKVFPIAKKVEAKTGFPAPVLSAMMSWETASGTNASSRFNNYLGIKYVGQSDATLGKVAGIYAGYASEDDFVNDVVRILNIQGYGYPQVLLKVKNNPKDYEGIIRAWNASSWAEANYDVKTIVERAKLVEGVEVTGGNPILALNWWNPANMDRDDLLRFATIGAVFLMAVRLVTEE